MFCVTPQWQRIHRLPQIPPSGTLLPACRRLSLQAQSLPWQRAARLPCHQSVRQGKMPKSWTFPRARSRSVCNLFCRNLFMYRHRTNLSNVWLVILVTFWVALICVLTELFSKNGKDTFFCPMLSMCALIILTLAAGGI